ncbi:MAG: GNAT family N-acetyltransferase [Ferruginibacter sp.]|nr:GNAT family N-acetyltransferase [Chitinophagaceae bacterium]
MLQPNFTPFPELITERLLLRKLTPDDAPAIFILRSDERVLRFIGREPAASLNEAGEFIERIDRSAGANEAILWGIVMQDDPGTVIGTICYWRLQPENYRAEIGYALHPDHWRKGMMKEAIRKVLAYGFDVMKLHSIEGRISKENAASAAILEKTGFVKEAHLKEEFFFRGKFLDTIIYSRLQTGTDHA